MKIGLTGGIGSGKTTVSKIFAALGVPIYYSDDRAKALMNTNEELIGALKELLGDNAYNKEGYLDRAFVSKSVFGNADLLEKLNNLVHPMVKKDLEDWVSAHHHCPYVIQESALIFERGINQRLDKVILVTSPKQLRIDRLKKRDPQRSSDGIESIMAMQWEDNKKETLADFIIRNDQSHMLISQSVRVHNEILSSLVL